MISWKKKKVRYSLTRYTLFHLPLCWICGPGFGKLWTLGEASIPGARQLIVLKTIFFSN